MQDTCIPSQFVTLHGDHGPPASHPDPKLSPNQRNREPIIATSQNQDHGLQFRSGTA